MRTLTHLLGSLPTEMLRLSVWLVLLIAFFVPLERFFGRKQSVLRKGFWTDLAYYFISNVVPNMVLIIPLTLLTWAIHRLIPDTIYDWASVLPIWARIALAMIVGEIGAYCGHRWSHELPVLWRFHAIHHSAEEVDWLVHTRAHPVDMIFTRLCGFVPLYLTGLAQPAATGVDSVPFIVTILGSVWGFFIHSNIKWRLGPIEWLISSPAFHHWHHTNDGPAVINKNYAPMLPWIDRLFGTLYLPAEWPEKYGINDAVPDGLASQLVQPISEIGGPSWRRSSEESLPIPAGSAKP